MFDLLLSNVILYIHLLTLESISSVLFQLPFFRYHHYIQIQTFVYCFLANQESQPMGISVFLLVPADRWICRNKHGCWCDH